MLVAKQGNCAELNIHGMTAGEAKRCLEQYLSHAPKDVTEIRVIHGYNSGQVLLDMVRRRLKHPRIAAKLVSLSPGETRLLLKPLEQPRSTAKKSYPPRSK